MVAVGGGDGGGEKRGGVGCPIERQAEAVVPESRGVPGVEREGDGGGGEHRAVVLQRNVAGEVSGVFLDTERGGDAVDHAVADGVEGVGPGDNAKAVVRGPREGEREFHFEGLTEGGLAQEAGTVGEGGDPGSDGDTGVRKRRRGGPVRRVD